MTTRILGLALLVTTSLACGDDGSPADDTGSGTGPGSTSMTPMTVTEAASSTGEGSSSSSSEGAESESSPADTGTSAGDDTSGTGSTGSSGSSGGGDTDTGSTGDSSTGAAACTPIAFTLLDEPALSGQGFCEGVQTNTVLTDPAAVADHHQEWCASVAACVFPEPPCDPAPALPEKGEQIVYVFGTDSGCAGVAAITDVLDCGDEIEVHYTIIGNGMCGTIVHAWGAAAIPASDAEVVFVAN
jgi:hypothetical protein